MKTRTVTHTPGPWRIGDSGNTVFGPKTDNPSPERVATIHGGTNDQCATSRVIVMKANVHLIAAAPELLSALRFVVQCELDRDEESRNFDNDTILSFHQLISKAEGK